MFFIFLYQRYIYRVDYKRVNEFGVSGEDISPDAKPAVEGSEIVEPNTEVSDASDKKND